MEDLNGGKTITSEKTAWYQKRRAGGPKNGPRTYQRGDKAKLDNGMDRIDWSKKAK